MPLSFDYINSINTHERRQSNPIGNKPKKFGL